MFSLFAFCVGIAIYFALPFEPAIAFPLLIAVLCAANFVIFRKKSIAPVFAFLFGFFYCAAFVRLIDIPRLTSPKRDIEISGVVKNIDYTPDKARIRKIPPPGQFTDYVSEEIGPALLQIA